MENDLNYNDEPVFYCAKCLSLRIRSITGLQDSEYCDECGSTNVETCHISEWENKYVEVHKHKYLENY